MSALHRLRLEQVCPMPPWSDGLALSSENRGYILSRPETAFAAADAAGKAVEAVAMSRLSEDNPKVLLCAPSPLAGRQRQSVPPRASLRWW